MVPCVLTKDISLLQADGQPEVFACLGEVIHQQMQFPLGVSHDCGIVSKEHVSNEGFGEICPHFKVGKIEEPAIWPVPQVDSLKIVLC